MSRLTVISFVLLLLSATSAAAQSANAAGTWDATFTSPQGTSNAQMILKQDGGKITGTIKDQRGEMPIEGTIDGKDLKLKFTIKFQNNDMVISLAATQEGAGIKGSADYGGFASGEFNAKRTSEPAAAAATSAPANATPASDKTDVSGAWAFKVESSAGSGAPTFTFKQDGEKLSGQYKGAFGEAPLTGTVKDNKIAFTLKIEAQGQQLTLTYTGTVEKDGSMKGTVDAGEFTGTWTGKRQ
jgi:hypothetical protein